MGKNQKEVVFYEGAFSFGTLFIGVDFSWNGFTQEDW
jgi:hypothetical protein